MVGHGKSINIINYASAPFHRLISEKIAQGRKLWKLINVRGYRIDCYIKKKHTEEDKHKIIGFCMKTRKKRMTKVPKILQSEQTQNNNSGNRSIKVNALL